MKITIKDRLKLKIKQYFDLLHETHLKLTISNTISKCNKYPHYYAILYYRMVYPFNAKISLIEDIIKVCPQCACNRNIRIYKHQNEFDIQFINGSRFLVKKYSENNSRGYRFHYAIVDKGIPKDEIEMLKYRTISKEQYCKMNNTEINSYDKSYFGKIKTITLYK